MSTQSSIDIFKARYPQLVTAFSLADATIGIFLDEAAVEVSKCSYGAYYQKAVLLHTAHFITLESYANAKALDPSSANAAFTAVGGISSASVDDTSISRNLAAPTSADEGAFSSTIFGQEFLRISKKMGKGALLAHVRVSTEGCAESTLPGILF